MLGGLLSRPLEMRGASCPSLENASLPRSCTWQYDQLWAFWTCSRAHLLCPPGKDTDYNKKSFANFPTCSHLWKFYYANFYPVLKIVLRTWWPLPHWWNFPPNIFCNTKVAELGEILNFTILYIQVEIVLSSPWFTRCPVTAVCKFTTYTLYSCLISISSEKEVDNS